MEYKDTIFLPKTSFEMRANLPSKEPAIIEEWDKENIFKKLRDKSKGREKLGYLKGSLKILIDSIEKFILSNDSKWSALLCVRHIPFLSTPHKA